MIVTQFVGIIPSHMARIAILTTPEGHFSIAKAMEETLQTVHETRMISIRDSVFELYTPFYQFFPSMYHVPYALSKQTAISTQVVAYLRKKLMKQVAKFIEESQPDIIINTMWIYRPALETLEKKNHIPIINVITDPWSIHPLFISEVAESNLVFDEKTLKTCQSYNPDATYDVTGWFVRKAFYQKTNATAFKKQLKLDPKQQTILIAGGSEGTTMIVKLVPALMQLAKPINIIVMCGNNKSLLNSIKSLSKIIKAVSNQSHVVPVGFTHDVAEYMGVADLIIGKAGPNTIFETVAARKPFIAVTHISGQEDGNLDLIKQYKLGYVEENAIKVVKLLQGVLKNPARLKKLAPSIAKMADINHEAGPKLLEIVERTLDQNR